MLPFSCQQRLCSARQRAQAQPCTSIRRARPAVMRVQQQQQQQLQLQGAKAAVGAAGTDSLDALTDQYNEQMAKQMGWASPFEYHFDRGLYMHEIVPGLFCGTQPRNPGEVEQLARGHGVNVILNLQQDKDMEYWGVNFGANEAKCRDLGVTLLRKPAQDFDPHSLRNMLPSAVQALQAELAKGNRVYVHCTAGLGRAPAVCIAWLYWYGPYLALHEAYDHLTRIRPCGPNRDAVRGATYDVLDDRHFDEFFRLPEDAWAFLNEQDKARLQQRIANR